MKTATTEILIRLEKFTPADQNIVLLAAIKQLQERREAKVTTLNIESNETKSAFDSLERELQSGHLPGAGRTPGGMPTEAGAV